jgi:hypothetical protein
MRDARYVRLISWTLQSGSKHLLSFNYHQFLIKYCKYNTSEKKLNTLFVISHIDLARPAPVFK